MCYIGNMLTTCTLTRTADMLEPVTIGWANFAKYADFKAILAERISRGYSYVIVEPHRSRTVCYSAALLIDDGTSELLRTHVPDDLSHLVKSGDITLVRVGNIGK